MWLLKLLTPYFFRQTTVQREDGRKPRGVFAVVHDIRDVWKLCNAISSLRLRRQRDECQ